MKKTLVLLMALIMALSSCSFVIAEGRDDVVAYSRYGWVVSPATQDENHVVSIEMMLADPFEHTVVTSSYPLDTLNAETNCYEADSIVALMRVDTVAEVLYNAADEVIGFEVIEKTGAGMRGTGNYNYYFDSAEFGGELTAPGGGPGKMVALGWIIAKDADNRTITIGDGNHLTYVFEETYNLADDAEIFLVDNGYSAKGQGFSGTWEGVAATMDDIPVCQVEGPDGKFPGEMYYVAEKYTALVVFDGDYTTLDKGAKAEKVYVYKNAATLMDSELAQPDGMQWDGTSWLPAANRNDEKTGLSYNGSCEPFAIMAGRLYYFGDCYSCLTVMVGDNGETTILDMGNETATYQYWLNLKKLGFDPRKIDHVMLTHGHGDHYQALEEFITMTDRYHRGQGECGTKAQYVDVITSVQNKTGYDYLGYPEIGPQLSDNSIRFVITGWTQWYEWRDLGGGASIYPFLSTGHSADSPSFGMLFTATAEDEYFKEGDKVGFIYCGAYGAQSRLGNGWMRLAMTDAMMYLQSVVAPYVDSLCDYIYYMPQHTLAYPILEIAYCARTAGVPLMSVYGEGVANIQNVMEKRISVNYNEEYQQIYKEKTNDWVSNLIEPATGWRCSTSNANFQTIEAYGPYKRPAGEYEMEVVSASIIRGFMAFQNPQEAFRGIKNIYGFDMADGILIDKDGYTDDHDRYCVQIVCHIKDDYQGKVDYETNWYGAENYAQAWQSGPVEIVNRPEGTEWTEIVRTAKVSKEDAEAMLATIEAGGVYKVNLTIASGVIVADVVTDTFIPVEE